MIRSLKYAALSAAVALMATATMAQTPQTEQQKQQRAPETAVAGATVEKIADNPEMWYGKKVTLKAKIGDVFSRRVFNVEEEGVVDVDDEVLIVAPKSNTYLRSDQVVTVTGEVRQFVRTDIERTFDGLDWDLAPDLLVQFERRPVVLADSVVPSKQ